MTERVAIYARVSTDEQAERETIENQLQACRDYCRSRRLEVMAEFRDEGVSGVKPFGERPEGKRLLALAGDGLFERVLVYCPDRLARDVVEAGLAMRELKRLKIVTEFVSHSFDDTPEGEALFNMLMLFAQYERRIIARRTHAGRERVVREGRYISGPIVPYGYRRVDDGRTLEPHPETAEVVRLMFRWATEGSGLKAIASRLDDMRVPPPNPKESRRRIDGWRWVTVYGILKHPRYVGRATYGKGKVPMQCPPLVDDDTFAAAAKALSKRMRDSFGNTKRFYLLQHLLHCRTCGSRYMSYTENQKQGPVSRYVCRRRMMTGPRGGHEGVRWRWRAEELEDRVKGVVRALYGRQDFGKQQVEAMVRWVTEEASEQELKVTTLERRLEELAREELRVLEWARKGYVDDTQMLQQLDQVRAERQDVEHDLQAARKLAEESDKDIEAAEAVAAIYDSLEHRPGFYDEVTGEPAEPSDEEWRDLITSVVDRIWVEEDSSLTLEGAMSATSSAFTSSSSC